MQVGSAAARACALLACAALLACRGDPELPAGPIDACDEIAWDAQPQRRNVVLIVNDTMRQDRAGVYGGAARTPSFDRVAQEGFHLTRSVSQAPWTKPSIATLFTGLYPSQHGVLTHPLQPAAGTAAARSGPLETDVLSGRLTTLAEVLHDAGYRTAGFVANPWMQRRYGFAQGFDEYTIVPGPPLAPGQAVAGVVDPALANTARGEAISRAGADWLAARSGSEPFFLYLHYMDSHGPYPSIDRDDLERNARRIAADRRQPSAPALQALEGWWRLRRAELPDDPPLGSRDAPLRLTHLEIAYEKGIERFDSALASLLDALARSPAAADTAVLITSDHGESFFERGWGEHGYGLFEEELRVPFAARMPGVATRGAVDCPVGLIDVMATLCTYLGVPCPQPGSGESFLRPPDPAASRPQRYLVSEGVFWRPHHRAIRNAHYKLLWEPEGRPRALEPAPEKALFALESDPSEEHDLLQGDRTSPYSQRAFETLHSQLGIAVAPFATPAEKTPIDAETRSRLEALGYMESEKGASPKAPERSDGDAPRP
jgi:arylsulfatase